MILSWIFILSTLPSWILSDPCTLSVDGVTPTMIAGDKLLLDFVDNFPNGIRDGKQIVVCEKKQCCYESHLFCPYQHDFITLFGKLSSKDEGVCKYVNDCDQEYECKYTLCCPKAPEQPKCPKRMKLASVDFLKSRPCKNSRSCSETASCVNIVPNDMRALFYEFRDEDAKHCCEYEENVEKLCPSNEYPIAVNGSLNPSFCDENSVQYESKGELFCCPKLMAIYGNTHVLSPLSYEKECSTSEECDGKGICLYGERVDGDGHSSQENNENKTKLCYELPKCKDGSNLLFRDFQPVTCSSASEGRCHPHSPSHCEAELCCSGDTPSTTTKATTTTGTTASQKEPETTAETSSSFSFFLHNALTFSLLAVLL